MQPIPYLEELLVVAAGAVLAAIFLGRLKLPIITVLLLAGAAVGPHGLRLVTDPHRIEVLAEVGVVLLLFTIGLEFSLARLARIGRLVAVGGALQVGLTIAAVTGVLVVRGSTASRGIFFGCLIALSSTAIVLRALAERNEVDAPHGRFIVGALIFQDICVVPMMLIVPILAGRGEGSAGLSVALALGKATIVVALTLVLARFLVPRFFGLVDKARSREVFLLSVLFICLGTAWLTALTGLSLALGAFLAGMILADSDYAHRAMGEVLPLRDVLTSVFFMSLGMLFDPRVIVQDPRGVAAWVAALLIGKGLIATLAALAMRFPLRVALIAGAGLAQFGEFGFVLARTGGDLGLLRATETRALLGGAILSMLVTPIALRVTPHLAAGASRLRGLSKLMGVQGIDEPAAEHAHLTGHVIVVGYGIAGRVLAAALRDCGMPYIVLEINAETVLAARKAGEPVYYADVTSQEALAHAHARDAKSIVLLINDPKAAERAIVAAKSHAPATPVFVRTHFLRDAPMLKSLGATEVVVEEVEAGIEMLSRALRQAGAPRNVLLGQIERARSSTQKTDRTEAPKSRRLRDLGDLGGLRVDSFLVHQGSFAVGRSARALDLRARTGALLVAVRRAGDLLDQVDPAEPFQAGDVLFLAGAQGSLAEALTLLEDGANPAEPTE
ncbi:MAG TPA: cation:proton antiporter [Polyangiaceae bacterium]|nr:cation:proton antiporter [Polyangiaceae bacterium]